MTVILILGVSQLEPVALEKTRKIASVRIHVERVIGSIRQKYAMLHNGSLPIDMLRVNEEGESLFDKVVVVCCGLVNLCPSMVQ